MTTVRIYHTTNLRDARFEFTAEAIEVFEYTSEWTAALDACEEAFVLFNEGTNFWAAAYRARHNRSLSIGDLVVVDDEVYELRVEGWIRQPELPRLIEENRHGSIWAHGPVPEGDELAALALIP